MKPKNKSFFNLDATLEHAVKDLSVKDPQKVAADSASDYNPEEGRISLIFLQDRYHVNHPSGEVITDTGDKASTYNAIIILHYLNTADGTPLEGRWISFKELTGGQIYTEPFRNRAIVPLIKTFGDRPEAFLQAARSIGGKAGDDKNKYSMIIPVLPRVKINFILFPGDEEFPASGNILLDARANNYLPTEDYAHLPGMIIRKMSGK